MNVLILDNYDSFVYNIAHLLGELKTNPAVVRNDKITIADI
ncbi:MAG TPA: aminodeoxychorismate/anthranilate synthase component II, partial [Nitrososphaeraceae archaeon]